MSREVQVCISVVGQQRVAFVVNGLSRIAPANLDFDSSRSIDLASRLQTSVSGDRRAIIIEVDGQEKQIIMGPQISVESIELEQIHALPTIVKALGPTAAIAGYIQLDGRIFWLMNERDL